MDPAGLKLQLHHSQTESRLPERLNGQISTSPHKYSSLAQPMMMDVMVDTPSQVMSTCTRTTSLMRHALIIEPEDILMVFSAPQLSNARTATHTRNALFLTNTTSTESMSSVNSRVRKP